MNICIKTFGLEGARRLLVYSQVEELDEPSTLNWPKASLGQIVAHNLTSLTRLWKRIRNVRGNFNLENQAWTFEPFNT